MIDQKIHVGTIGRPHGVRGLLHVHSYTENPEDLNRYGELIDDFGEYWTLDWRGDQIAALKDQNGQWINDRTQAEKLTNRKLFALRIRFSKLEEDEFYLVDLIGLEARIISETGDLCSFGTVKAVHDYGAGISLEIKQISGEIVLLPFTKHCVPLVNIEAGWLEVCLPEEVEVPMPLKNQGIE